ncbi:hypothetical protein [Kitasatospora albolonga]|uniref:hypothetical protein n=1 Tax=Kitasatospora albolonga TaxID=68173 RepID=UPI0031E941CF
MRILMQVGFAAATLAALVAVVLIVRDWRRLGGAAVAPHADGAVPAHPCGWKP